jgi:hypothetical protein
MKHLWTECDDVVALYLFRFGSSNIGLSIEGIAEKLGMSYASMKMRIRNFQSLAGGGGLPHIAEQSKSIFARFKTLSELELRARAIRCLDNRGTGNGMVS